MYCRDFKTIGSLHSIFEMVHISVNNFDNLWAEILGIVQIICHHFRGGGGGFAKV